MNPKPSTAKTPAQRMAAFRARKAAQQLSEVRGIFAPPALHPPIRAFAKRLTKQSENLK